MSDDERIGGGGAGDPTPPGPAPDDPTTSGSGPTCPENADRRGFFSQLGTVLMAGGILSSYGTFAALATRYLFPARPRDMRWMYVTRVKDMRVGDALDYRTPEGAAVTVARQGDTGNVSDFVALSSTCPHLGCQVHWEVNRDRFFCPCHNGTFDPAGLPTGGPPKDANQSLPQFALKIEKELLYIEVPTEKLTSRPEPIAGDGHDPCLQTRLHTRWKGRIG